MLNVRNIDLIFIEPFYRPEVVSSSELYGLIIIDVHYCLTFVYSDIFIFIYLKFSLDNSVHPVFPCYQPIKKLSTK